MRRLILMRHAKSSWADPGQPDQDRPLNPRGRRASAAVGAWLRSRGYLPDQALVSNARRCQETWTGVAAALDDAPPASTLPDLYHADAETMLAVIRQAGGASTVLLLGHQPGIGDLAARLLHQPPPDPDFQRYPTAATAVIDFDVDGWQGADWGVGALRDFVVPASLS